MNEPQNVEQPFDKRLRRRARLLRFLAVLTALYAASMSGIIIHALIERTDWSSIFPEMLLFGAVLGLIYFPVIGVVYLIAWIPLLSLRKLRSKPISKRFPDYLLAGALPALFILGFLALAALDRASPQRIFQRLTGHPIPEEASLVSYTNTSEPLETHLSIEFRAPASGIRKMLGEMGFTEFHDQGKQEFSPVQIRGDMGMITVDWDHQIMLFEYLDV